MCQQTVSDAVYELEGDGLAGTFRQAELPIASCLGGFTAVSENSISIPSEQVDQKTICPRLLLRHHRPCLPLGVFMTRTSPATLVKAWSPLRTSASSGIWAEAQDSPCRQ